MWSSCSGWTTHGHLFVVEEKSERPRRIKKKMFFVQGDRGSHIVSWLSIWHFDILEGVMNIFRPSVFTKSENCPSEVPPTAGRRGTLSSEPPPSATLHEAILASSSSVRDSLPEQHRVHFETLRQEIIAFAQDHEIPKEALAKPDALREAAQKLSTSDLTQLADLLERFRYLLIHKEPRREVFEAVEYAERLYHLKEQYDSQVKLLEEAGILDNGAVMGIDGKTYTIPTLEQIAVRIFERRETLETKHKQGFTKLLLVPFGMSFNTLWKTFKQFLLSYKQKHLSFDLDTYDPLWTSKGYQGGDMEEFPELVYHPQSFEKSGHGGKTKAQILKEQETIGQAQGDDDRTSDNGWKGWTVHLFQPSDPGDPYSPGIAPIPRKGQGTPQGDENPRPPLEAGQSPIDYLSLLLSSQNNKNSPYFQESSLTPEDWVIAFITHLTETGEPIDSWIHDTESISYLSGAFCPFSVSVPSACWYCGRLPLLENCGPYHLAKDIGVRSSVIL